MIFLLLPRLEVSSQVPGRTLQEAESPGKMRNDSCKAFHQVLTKNEEGSENDIIFVYYIYIYTIYIYTVYCTYLYTPKPTSSILLDFSSWHLQLDPKVGHWCPGLCDAAVLLPSWGVSVAESGEADLKQKMERLTCQDVPITPTKYEIWIFH